jgi:hypothetical protein
MLCRGLFASVQQLVDNQVGCRRKLEVLLVEE